MNRRDILRTSGLMAVAALASGCGANGKLPELPVNIGVNLPPEIKEVIDDATAALAKVESLGANITTKVGGLIEQGKGLVSQLSTGKGDTKSIVSGIVSTLGSVATFLPPPYGTIALAIETLLPIIGGVVGMKMAARRPTGMSPATARAVLRS